VQFGPLDPALGRGALSPTTGWSEQPTKFEALGLTIFKRPRHCRRGDRGKFCRMALTAQGRLSSPSWWYGRSALSSGNVVCAPGSYVCCHIRTLRYQCPRAVRSISD